MVLVTVIGVILVMAVVTVSFLSHSISQTTITQDQIDQIKSQTLCTGIVAKAYSDRSAGNPINVPATVTLDGKIFTVNPPTAATSEVTATCSY